MTKIEVLGKTKPLETYFKLLEDVGGYPEPIERFGEGVSEKESHGEKLRNCLERHLSDKEMRGGEMTFTRDLDNSSILIGV